MQYKGKYKIFDTNKINTYPLNTRTNKVTLKDLVMPDDVDKLEIDLPDSTCSDIESIAESTILANRSGKPVILFTGAHLIKNGLGPLLVDLVNRGLVSLVAGNGATAIHDFELALIGQTSEYVPNALGEGQFGMAYEFAFHNAAISLGNKKKLGYGESLALMICDENFRSEVLQIVTKEDSIKEFPYPQLSVLAACYQKNIPFTVHVGIGTDVIDQHGSFDGQAKGGCSGRDFLMYTQEVSKLNQGGINTSVVK